MRTAIHLLILVALASAVGSLVPQSHTNPDRAIAWVAEHGRLGMLVERAGGLDLFDSWWFSFLTLLLLVSLGACLAGRWLDWIVSARRRAADRRWLALGSLVFHSSIFLIVFGGIWGHWTGYDGTVNLVEGQTWTDTHAAYDRVSEGPLFAGHLGFQVKVDSVHADFEPSGLPRNFLSELTITEGNTVKAIGAVRPNDKLVYRGVKFYQARYGLAPQITVRNSSGEVISDSSVLTFGNLAESDGVLKVPVGGPGRQLGLEITLVPDPAVVGGNLVPRGPNIKDPVLQVSVFRGDLGLDRPQNVFVLDHRRLSPAWSGFIGLGQVATIPGGETIRFTGLRHYTGLQIGRDDGVPVVYAGFVILLAGLTLRAWLPLLGRFRDPLEAP